LRGRDVRTLVHGDGALWAIADGHQILRSDGDGQWEEVAVVDDLRATCLLPAVAGVLAGTTEARLLWVDDGQLTPVTTFDDAPGRDGWDAPDGGPPSTRSLAEGPRGELFVNVHVGGILRSTDEGGSWDPVFEVDFDVHQVASDADAGVVLVAGGGGFAWSDDAGDSWRTSTAGLHAPYARAVALADETVVLSASTGPSTRESALYRRALDGREFVACRDGLPEWFRSNVDTGCLVAAGRAVAAAADGSVYLSENCGETWALVADGLPTVRCVVIE